MDNCSDSTSKDQYNYNDNERYEVGKDREPKEIDTKNESAYYIKGFKDVLLFNS